MQKSPRMVPGVASTGFVAPMSAREARTTSRPCHTCAGGRESARRPRAARRPACPPAGTYHGHHWSRAHVLHQAPIERALPQLGVVLPQQLLGGLGKQGDGPDAPGTAASSVAAPAPDDPRVLRPPPPTSGDPGLTCTNFSATSLKPFLSKRRTISPTSRRCTPSGFTARKVRSCTPV